MKINLDSYINLISDYIIEKITGKCFEYTYWKLFHEERGTMSKEEFSILNTLFLDVDEFCSDPGLIGKYDIGEDELRKRCKIALKKLTEINQINL